MGIDMKTHTSSAHSDFVDSVSYHRDAVEVCPIHARL